MDIGEIISEVTATADSGYGEYVTVRGIRTRYFTTGDGPPLILLHGFGSFIESWALNVPPLRRHHRVYVIDLPGHGLSDNYDGIYTPQFIIDFTRSFMDTLGITRASFIGHSLGGLVSLYIAFSLPARVDRLVLVDSAGLSAEMPRIYRLCALPGLGRILMKTVMSRNLEKGMRRLFPNSNVVSPQMLDIIIENSHQTAVETLLQLLRRNVGLTGLKPDIVMADKLPRIEAPILFVHGTRDRIFPLSQVAPAFALAPQTEVAVFDDCGHCPHIEQAVVFNETATAFLNAAPER